MVNKNYRQYNLETGRIIIAGKSSEQNDLLVESSKKNDVLLHTEAPGSPFVNLGENPTSEEISEASVFCALKSQDWRDRKGNVKVSVFLKADCSKPSFSKSGSWVVKKNLDVINVKKMKIIELKNKLNI